MTGESTSPKWDVFISYARKDDESFVDRLRRDLVAAGKKVWWDKTSMESRGRSFLVEIRDAIWNSERLIAVIGPNALQSTYVWQEWAYAYHFSKAIVPILLRGSYESISEEHAGLLWRDEFERVPDKFDSSHLEMLHCPDFTGNASYQDVFDELLRVLNSDLLPLAPILGRPPQFPPPNFLPRRRAIKRLTNLRLLDPKDLRAAQAQNRIMVIHGPGGSGKSVAANAIAHAVQTQWTFEDGIVWLRIGKPSRQEEYKVSEKIHVLRGLTTLGRALGQNTKGYQDVNIAKDLVKELLYEKRCLLILDDVWDSGDAQDFVDVLGARCSMYITTRDRTIATGLSVPVVSLGDEDLELDHQEAKQLLADWAQQRLETLPPEAEEVAKICGQIPLSLAICGAVIQNGFSWKALPQALLSAMDRVVEAKIPSYEKDEISVFAPISVSLDYLKYLDEKDKQADKEPIDRYGQYLDLSALPAGEEAPEDVVTTLWMTRRDTNELMAFRLLGLLDAWALLRKIGEHPFAYILLHRLQTAYLQKLINKQELEILHRELGRALFDTWRTGKFLSGRPLREKERNEAENYCCRFLFIHLREGKCWSELRRLLGNVQYLEAMQDPEGQLMLEDEIAELLKKEDAPIKDLLTGALKGINEKMPLGRERADWLDTFAYWLNKYGCEAGRWQSEQIKNVARKFDTECGSVSNQLIQMYLKKNKQDWVIRYAELSAWAYQRAGDFESCAKACEEAERICAEEGLEKGYKTLGRVEFVRMRAHVLSILAEAEKDPGAKKAKRKQADQAYLQLALDFSKIGPQNWLLSKEEWQLLETDTPSGFDLRQRKIVDTSCSFKAVVVSNSHDAISAMYIIEYLEKKGGLVDWLHHKQFATDHPGLKESALVVLIGGPKTPGISDVADRFYNSDPEGYLRMYSGLHFGPSTLSTSISGIPYFMLGGISKAHTLLAAYNFTNRADLDEIIG